MSTSDDIRRRALELPEAEECTHFRLPAFRVDGKVFAVLQSDEHAVLHVGEDTARSAVGNDSGAIEEVRRGSTLVGIRVALAEVPAEKLTELVAAAWRHRAPRRLHPATGTT